MRDDFQLQVKETLAKRVRYRCSSPHCQQPTSGPQTDPNKAVNVGVAAHITAASKGGPRYDDSLSAEQRKSAENGVWLCQKCGKLVDSDEARYTAPLLRDWKKMAEDMARREIEAGAAHKSTEDPPLSELEFKILVVVGRQERVTTREVALAVHVSEQKAKLYLDELNTKHGLIDWYGNMNPGESDHYMLRHAGRRLLVERNML